MNLASRNERPIPSGLLAGTGLVALAVLFLLLVPGRAAGAELVPCEAPAPPGEPTISISGDANLSPVGQFNRALKRSGVRLRTVRPAENTTGQPRLPMRGIQFADKVSRIGLGGGLRLVGKRGRTLGLGAIQANVRNAGASVISAKVGKRRVAILKIRARSNRDLVRSQVELNGAAVITPAFSRLLRQRFGTRKVKQLRAGKRYGRVHVYASRTVIQPENPEVEIPEQPPVLDRPASATSLTGGSIQWRPRASFIEYMNTEEPVAAHDGAIPASAEDLGKGPLVYSFGFPFSEGWTDAASGTTAVTGSGGIGLRFCSHTINFIVSDPEIELNGDLSRMIFRVNGSDGTSFPNIRAVLVGLRLSEATVTTEGKTTTYSDVPGFIPTGATGVFADFYMPGSDFGTVTVSVTEP